MHTENLDFREFDNFNLSEANWQHNGNLTETDPLYFKNDFSSSGGFSPPSLEEFMSSHSEDIEFQWNFSESESVFKDDFRLANSSYQYYEWNHPNSFTGDEAIDSNSIDSSEEDVFTDSEAVLGAAVFQTREQLENFTNEEEFLSELNQAFDLD